MISRKLEATTIGFIVLLLVFISGVSVYFKNCPQCRFSVLSSSAFSGLLGRHNIVFGFLPYWTLDKSKDIDLDVVTDISYFGLNVNSKGEIIKNDGPYTLWEKDSTQDFFKTAKSKNVRTGVTLVMHQDNSLDKFLDCEECWKTLLQQTTVELVEKDFNDINLDFEYAGYTSDSDNKKFTKFIEYFAPNIRGTRSSAVITVSAFADATENKRLVDVSDVKKYVDGFFVMAYDFHGLNSSSAGPIAPLGGSFMTTKLNVEKVVDNFIKEAGANKVILGIPYYGYDWPVVSQDQRARVQSSKTSNEESFTRSYSDITKFIKENNLRVLWDEQAKSPYINYVTQDTKIYRQAYFENKDSIKAKVELSKSKKILGVGIWALGFDSGYSELWKLYK